MLVFYDRKPEVRQYEQMPVGTMVFFRENIVKEEPIDEFDTWSADEYPLAFSMNKEATIARVEANPSAWIERAKRASR